MKHNSIRAYNRKIRRLYARLEKDGKGGFECIICGTRWDIHTPKNYCVCGICEKKRKNWTALVPVKKKRDGTRKKHGQTLMLPGNAIHLLMKNSGRFIGQDIIGMNPKMVRALRKKYETLLQNMQIGASNVTDTGNPGRPETPEKKIF